MTNEASRTDREPRRPSVPDEARATAPRDHAPRGDEPGDDPDRHGVTAEDGAGVGFGEEGFRAEDYPGDHRLRGESEEDLRRRHASVWSWPRREEDTAAPVGEGPRADRRICEAIGERILQAEPDLRRVVVHVLEGRVWLEGEVSERDDAQVVEALAEGVIGVASVKSSLVVRHPGRTSAG